MGENFNWSGENEDIVQRSVQSVAAYVNSYGQIVVRQEVDYPHEEEDSIIILNVDSARRLSERLRELISSMQMQ